MGDLVRASVPPSVGAEVAAATPPTPALGRIAAGGFAWTFALTMVGKVVSTGAQLVLARLLLPADYGLYALATATAIIPNVVRDAGTVQILVQRRHEFATLANAAFWMSLTLGLAMGAMIALFAPAAAELYNAPQLVPLGLVLAAASPFNALTIVPNARLQIDLRLRTMALLGVGGMIFTTVLTILLAWRGWGAMSLVLPALVVAVVRLPVVWMLAPVPLTPRLEIGKWRQFLADSVLLIGTAVCWALTFQGDNAVLGLFASDGLLGYYSWALGLSMQTVQLLAGSLSVVLFPTLSRLKDEPARQRAAFLQACRMSAAVTVPLALLPIACATPLISLLFPPRWLPAVPLLQILSVAAAMATLGFPAGSYLMAQGRNRAGLVYAVIMSAFFLINVTVFTVGFAAIGDAAAATPPYQAVSVFTPSGPIGTALAVSVFHVVGFLAGFYLVLSPSGPVWRPTLAVAAVPVGVGAASVVAAAVATVLAGRVVHSNLLLVGISVLTLAAVYVPLVRWVAPDIFQDLAGRVRMIVAGRLGRARGGEAV